MKTVINARIISPEHEYSWMQFNKKGIITDVGTGTPTIKGEVIDARNKLILPGLHDSHIHAYSLGRSLNRLDLTNSKSIKEIQQKIKAFKPLEKK